jgi:hypothetical protein
MVLLLPESVGGTPAALLDARAPVNPCVRVRGLVDPAGFLVAFLPLV